MKKRINGTLLLLLAVMGLVVPQTMAQPEPTRALWEAGFRQRADELVRVIADQVDPNDTSTGGYRQIIAKVLLDEDLDWAAARVDSLLLAPRGDMFWMYPVVTMQYLARDKFDEDLLGRIKDAWQSYAPYRGDTENHWAMYYASLYLECQLYPDAPGEAWFTGKSSAENMAEAKEYLYSWMDLTVTIGQGEYDSPDYLGVYISPMAMLYAFAEDPELRFRAQMMLDLILADFAVDTLNGLYTGAHSRVYPRQVREQWWSTSTGFSWLLFGNVPARHHPEPLVLIASGYRVPEIIYQIATDRETPFVHQEKKRTRHRIRNSDVKNAPVYKYSFMTEDYALGSTQGGLLQPIQQQTWDLTWAVDDPRDKHNTFFSIHPYSAFREGTMYFAEHHEMVTELIVRSKTTYDSADKWTGGSDYEQVFQHEDALIALYNIPSSAQYQHIGVFFSRDLDERIVDPSGWIFCRAGETFFAWYPLSSYDWQQEEDGNWRLHSPWPRNGGVLQAAFQEAYGTFGAFREAVIDLPLETTNRPVPGVRFTTLAGDRIGMDYGDVPVVNGQTIDYNNWPFYSGPFMESETGSRIITLNSGDRKRVLDFNKPSITEQ